MRQRTRINSTNLLLGAVAALLLVNLLATLGHGPSLLSLAHAQRQAPIAGGGGLFVMPAQLSGNTWGCYLMDIDRQTLSVYQYLPGSRELQFVAARNFTHDTKLGNFNTTPAPKDILDLVNKQDQAIRGEVTPPVEDEIRRDIP